MISPKLHQLNFDDIANKDTWEEIYRDAILFGTAFIKVDLKDMSKYQQFYGESPIDTFKKKTE